MGLERRSCSDLNADDIDILIPEKLLSDDWKMIEDLMNSEHYALFNAEEHEFVKSNVHIAYAAIESLVSFAGVDISAIPIVTDVGIQYYLLELSDYLKVYQASSKDGYRKNVKNKLDNHKNGTSH